MVDWKSQQNIFGSGNALIAAINTSQVNRTISVAFTQPYWTVDGISRVLEVYQRNIDPTSLSVSQYATSTAGAAVAFGVPITETDSVSVGLRYEHTSIDLFDDSPLRGHPHAALGPRFPDMSVVYDPGLVATLHGIAAREGIPLRLGVLAGRRGPASETPAELRFLHAAGADAVARSVVPEATAARHAGVKVAKGQRTAALYSCRSASAHFAESMVRCGFLPCQQQGCVAFKV